MLAHNGESLKSDCFVRCLRIQITGIILTPQVPTPASELTKPTNWAAEMALLISAWQGIHRQLGS